MSLLEEYMEEEDSFRRDILWLKIYAEKIENRTELIWEIPSVRSQTIKDIAKRLEKAFG